jgi:UrcA family protein
MKPKITKRSSLIGLTLLSAALTSSLALATPAGYDSSSVVVRYPDLNPSQPDGARALYRRIKTAARQACGDSNIKDLTLYSRYRECYEHAVANAVEEVKSRRVSELHRNETHL